MYKISVIDQNCPSGVTWLAEWFVDDLNRFEEEWIKKEDDEELIARFRRAKAGVPISDLTVNGEGAPLVVGDRDAKVCFEKSVVLENERIEITNSYGSKWLLCMDWCRIDVRFARFDGRYLRLAKYKAKGICVDRRAKHGTFSCAKNFGNPVLKTNVSDGVYAQSREPYRNDTVESFVWYPINEYESFEEMETVFREMKEPYFTREEYYELFWDIPGESG